MSVNNKISFSKYGKTFQEKLAFIILDDRGFADRMMEVLNIEFLEYKYLQTFVEKVFYYKTKYGSQPSHDTMKSIIKSGIVEENEVLQEQIVKFYAKSLSDINILESCEYIKDTALDFCRKQKLREAMMKSSTLLQKCSFDEISVLINNALKAGADADFGYDYIKDLYDSGIKWEQTRDSIYYRYQVNQKDEYNITSKNLYCNGCYAAGINFASSLVSLFYGEGNLKETIKIGTLAGWDSDNPTSTWGGLIGFIIGREMVEKEFNMKLSNKFNIHRTRKNFPNDGIDTFENMAKNGIKIVDKVVLEELNGKIDSENKLWLIPK